MSIRPADASVAEADPGAPAHRRHLVFAIVSLAMMMASVDQTIVATALDTLQHELHAQVSWTSWTITIYALGQILVMPVAGRLSERYGRKKVFLFAAVLFTAASLGCALANSIYLLVVLRAVQSIGGGAFMPSATGLLTDLYGPERDRAVALFASIFPIGALVGPILGGIFVTYWSWRGIFLVNLPLGLVLIVLGVAFIPAGVGRATHRLDVVGIGLLGVTVLSGMFGVAFLGAGSGSLLTPEFLVPEIVAATGLIGFVRHSARAEHPFIPLAMLHGRGYGVMNLMNFFYGAIAVGVGALVPLYAQDRYGIGVLDAGTLLTARGVTMTVLSAVAAVALRRTGHRMPIVVGFTITAAGLVMMWAAPHGLSPYLWLAAGAAIMGLGMGVATPAANNATMQLSPDSTAAIAGLRGMFRQSGGITGVAVTTAVLARSQHPGAAMSHVWIVFAILAIALLPLVRFVPDQKGSW